jgi:DNA-binding MarR family transcriptional regulator
MVTAEQPFRITPGAVELEGEPVMESDDQLLGTLRHSIVGLVRRDGPDFTGRQLATFLICYHESEAQTVRGLGARLSISKPAVSRALDRLEEFSLVRRERNLADRRSVWIQRTRAGLHFLGQVGKIMDEAVVKAERAEALRPGRPRRVERPAPAAAD